MVKNRIIIPGAILMVSAVFTPFVFSQDISQDIENIEEQTDVVEGPSAERASELYKQIKELQYGGASDEEYYPAVYAAFEEAYGALLTESTVLADADQCKGILMDLNNALAKGAIHYSMEGNSEEMVKFARAYVDTQLLPQMSSADLRRDKDLYPSMVYVAASGCYNAGDVDGAIKYFEEYLSTGETKQREQVSLFYGQALLTKKQYDKGIDAIVKASEEYPSNYQLLTMAMQLCIDGNRRDILAPLVERALTIKPDDEKLLNLQASVYEDQRNYNGALDIYLRLQELHPNSMSVNECVARSYYNLGTGFYNRSISELNEKEASKQRRQSNAYFSSAAEKYEELLANDPNNTGYLKALSTSYACLGNKSKVESLNVQLTALGQQPTAMNSMPITIGNGSAKEGEQQASRNIPSYQEYARAYVSEQLKDWAKRGEFEKLEDYEKRVSKENVRKEQERLSKIIADKYLRTYANHLAINELKLQPYDVDNETYAINSEFGPVYVKVPLKNKEAEVFKNRWDEVQIRNPKFFVKNDNIAIESISFITPEGKEYAYNAAEQLAYQGDNVVQVDWENIFDSPKAAPSSSSSSHNVTKVITAQSDVDKNIPQTKTVNSNTIALVIANENYQNVVKVASAAHDGDVFAQYCRETLGIPEKQVLLHQDATFGGMMSAVNKLKNSVSALGSGVDVIVYYAGHGVPDERTGDAYLMPVDADPMVMASAYSLDKFYKELGDLGADNVMVFLDACFSGANRGDGMLAEARGVVLVPNHIAPEGNMFILSAADGKETALPYKEKNHGLFTYYLLKKLQDSKGNATLSELSDYVSSEVKKTSSLTLNKPQNPKMTVSGNLRQEVSKKKLRK